MRRVVFGVLLLTVLVSLAGCRVKYRTLFLVEVPMSIWTQMKEAQEAGGAYLFRPEHHQIDAFYLLYSPGLGPNDGPTGPTGPAVRLLRRAYDNETQTLTLTIQRYIPQTGNPLQPEGNHSQSWYLIIRLSGPMEHFRVVTDDGEEIPVQVKR